MFGRVLAFFFCRAGRFWTQIPSKNASNGFPSLGISEGPLPISVGVLIRVSVGISVGILVEKSLLMFLSPDLKRWGPPTRQGLCSHRTRLWAIVDFVPRS